MKALTANLNIDVYKIFTEISKLLKKIDEENKETYAIRLHKEVAENLSVIKNALDDYDDWRKRFNEISKGLSVKILKSLFTKKAACAKYLLEYKKLKSENKGLSKSKEDESAFLNAMETVIDRVNDVKKKSKDNGYFKNKKSKPNVKIQNLNNKFEILKRFLEDIINS